MLKQFENNDGYIDFNAIEDALGNETPERGGVGFDSDSDDSRRGGGKRGKKQKFTK